MFCHAENTDVVFQTVFFVLNLSQFSLFVSNLCMVIDNNWFRFIDFVTSDFLNELSILCNDKKYFFNYCTKKSISLVQDTSVYNLL